MAGLFDLANFGLGNQNWFTWQGQPSPGQPAPGQPMQLTGTTPPAGTPPTGTPASPYTPDMIAQARYGLLAQMGMGLMAAGQPMTGAQRAGYMAELGQLPANYQKSLADQLEMAQKQQAYQRQQEQQAYLSSLSPDQLQKLGFTPEQATLFKGLGAPASIIEQKAFAQPGDPNTQVVEAGGRKLLIDQRTGNTVKDLGPVVQAPASPELVTLTPPSGSKASPQTFNVNDPADYGKAHDLMTRQNWTRAQAGNTVQVGSKLNEAQARVVQLYPNIYQDQQQLASLDKELTSPGGTLASKYGGNFQAYAQSDEYQLADRAASDFAANLLYIRSGATARPDEIELTKRTYFPVPGDSPANIAMKKRAREAAISGLRTSLGEQGPMLDPIEQQLQQQANPDLGAP